MELLPWQPECIDHLTTIKPEMNGLPHALLAAFMGSGKTVIGVNAIKKVKAKTVLILVPSAMVADQWRQTLVDWEIAEEQEIVIFEDTKFNLKDQRIVLVNYQKLRFVHVLRQILDRVFDVLIIDECQYLKTPSAQVTKIVFQGNKKKKQASIVSRCNWIWELSGTPVPNDLMELYPHLRVLASHLIGEYDTQEKFGRRYSHSFRHRGIKIWKGSKRTEELRERIRPFMKSVRAEDVYKEMPEVIVEPFFLDIPFNEIGGDESDTHMSVLRNLVGMAKVPYIIDYARGFIESTERKVVIYTYTREVTQELCEQLKGYNAVKIYGGMSDKAKLAAKNKFIEDPNCKPLILQMGCGGTGVDKLQLVCYDTIFAQWDWSGGGYQQQVARLRRLFQPSGTVIVHAMIARGTQDDKIIKSRKRKVATINLLLEPTTRKGTHMFLEEKIDRILAILEKQEGKPSASPAKDAAKDGGQKSASSAKSEKKENKEKEVTAEDARELCAKFVESFGDKKAEIQEGRDALAEILSKFKAKKIADLKGPAIAKAYAAIESALAAREEAEDEAEGEDDEDSDY